MLNGRPLCQDDRGCPIPKDRNWDRYDYLDARSNWNAPFARGLVAGSNNGMTLTQILGYRSILVNTGTYSEAALVEEDLELFGDWLVSPDCNANANRQVLCMNGDGMAGVIESVPGSGPAFLTDVLGASLFCDAFNGVSEDPDCQPPSESFCVRLLPSGGPFGTGLDVDAHGSGCPNQFRFDILRPAGTGVGNRSYSAEDGGKEADFAQIANEDLGAGANYRTILDGVSWHHVTARDPGGVGESVCPRDLPSIVAGAAGEIEAALRWGHDGAIPALSEAEELGACQNTWHFPAGVEAPGALPLADRLHGARPNPSGAEPAIHFSKAREGRMTLTVFDVTGRAVRTLVDGSVAPGLHSVVWDGRNDRGAAVGAGIYWAQMRTAEMKSTKRRVILK